VGMTEVIDAQGRWILSHAICRYCDRPSWDHFPEGVVADRYRCGYCGRVQSEGGLAVVARISSIHPHPNADRLEIIHADFAEGRTICLVTGKHYRIGDLGVWLKPGALIPGWLAHDLWLVGKNRSSENFTVREIEIRGVASPGLWVGQWYRNDSSKESKLRADELARGGGEVVDGWISWARWHPLWSVGDVVDEELEVRPELTGQVASGDRLTSRSAVSSVGQPVPSAEETP
jgi:tRNA-binding EMAP/Myf-like protein